MKYKRFEEMPIWKESMRISREIYKFTGLQPFSRDFGLKDQIQRSVVSIGSNIAEGFEMNSNKQFIKYLGYAKASTVEARTHLYLAIDLNYVNQTEGLKIMKRMTNLNSQIGGFIAYLKKKRPLNSQCAIRNAQSLPSHPHPSHFSMIRNGKPVRLIADLDEKRLVLFA